MSLLKDINDIITFGEKTTSYKFVTLMAIFDYIIEFPTEKPENNFHYIPLIYLSKQFLSYYYAFSFHSINQGTLAANKNIKILTYIESFKKDIEKKISIATDPEIKLILEKCIASTDKGINWLNMIYETGSILPKKHVHLLWKIRSLLLGQPLQYIHNVKGEIILFFALICNGIPFNSDYNAHRIEATRQKEPNDISYDQLLKYDNSFLIIDNLVYQELSQYRFWVREVILKAWYEYTLNLESKNENKPNCKLIYELLDYRSFNEIERISLTKYHKLYDKLGLNQCIYSNKDFSSQKDKYAIDHLLPWSYYPVNRFWNLYPSDPKINSSKSNLIPDFTQELEKNIRNHLTICLQNKKNPVIKQDLENYWLFYEKSDLSELAKKSDLELVEGLVLFLKNEWNNLKKIIPGKLYISP